MTRGVDEGDQPLVAVELGGDLVGADVLGDAAGLALADVGLPDGVQQSGLTVVDVTHDGHHRRTDLQVVLAALVLAVGEVEGLQQLAVLVLRADDLDDVVHLAAQQLQGLVADRLGGGDHLAEVEQRLHQRGRVGVDLLGEVAQRRAAGQPDGLAVAVRQPHAADDRRLHVLVLGAFRPLGLAATPRRTAGTAERAGGTAALPGTAAAATDRRRDGRGNHRRRRAGRRLRRRRPAAVVTAAAVGAAAAGTTRPATAGPGRRRHRVRGRTGPPPAPPAHRRDAAACCRARRRPVAGRPGRALPGAEPADADAGWAGRRAAPTRTGCCRRAGYGLPASESGRAAGRASHRGGRLLAGRRRCRLPGAGAAGGAGDGAALGRGAVGAAASARRRVAAAGGLPQRRGRRGWRARRSPRRCRRPFDRLVQGPVERFVGDLGGALSGCGRLAAAE